MREIKFRAWDGSSMIACDDKERYAMEWYGGIASILQCILDDEDFHWMQYTGLKDKNGVEIYEGDIVKKCYGSSTPIGVVAYHDCRAAYIYQDEYNVLLYEIQRPYEVIGNIYENPELLGE